MKGPGKYDHLCTHARVVSDAKLCILAIVDGAQGTGFSVQGDAEHIEMIPSVLREIADGIEADLAAGKGV